MKEWEIRYACEEVERSLERCVHGFEEADQLVAKEVLRRHLSAS
jgi:hypothetical protein